METIYSDYDAIIKVACPDYDIFLEIIAKAVPQNASEIINLGAGSGNLEKHIFAIKPNVRIYGIDMGSELLKLAKKKMDGYDFTPITGDIFTAAWPKCDIIVSSLTLHHFSMEQKKQLFKKIYSHLPADGYFLNYDYMNPGDTKEEVYEAIRKRMLSGGLSENIINELIAEAEKKDKPLFLPEEKTLLESIGFQFNLLHEEYSFAAYKCVKKE